MSTEKSHRDSSKRYREYLSEEVAGIYIYTQLAEIEDDRGLSEVYSHLAESEQRHIDLWKKELEKLGWSYSIIEEENRLENSIEKISLYLS